MLSLPNIQNNKSITFEVIMLLLRLWSSGMWRRTPLQFDTKYSGDGIASVFNEANKHAYFSVIMVLLYKIRVTVRHNPEETLCILQRRHSFYKHKVSVTENISYLLHGAESFLRS
jgi:hypothetical protein